MNVPIILASASPRRRELLEALGLRFEAIPSEAKEISDSHSHPKDLVCWNAKIKASDVARKFPDRWVLGADTVVALGNRLFGKPASPQEAETMLAALQGRVHCVYTGLCLLHRSLAQCEVWHEKTQVGFRVLSPDQIRDYLKRIHPLDKAGAYAIQEGGERIVSWIEGSLSNVVGLPLESLEAVLQRREIPYN